MSLADQIIDGGPYRGNSIGTLSGDADELNALRDELLELRRLRAAAETWGRFQVRLDFWSDEASLACPCGTWRTWITDTTTPLAELVRRAGEHTEDCP